MTRRANARIAGIAFLLYIALGITSMIVSGGASRGDGIDARLAALADHELEARLAAVLTVACGFAAIVLGVTLRALTREVDPDLAMLGLACRVGEGIVGVISIQRSLGLVWLASQARAGGVELAFARGLGAYLFDQRWSFVAAATLFAVGSWAFSWLLVRGRLVPLPLAWVGTVASVLLVVSLPLQLAGVLRGLPAQVVWAPMAVFEVWFAVWLLVKGVAPAPPRHTETG